ncbi:hypothetical protein, partial [Streptomyces sp. B15]|uniref:hypothetical protein n=1 Tax=Streptomyces sp. B15 TaxID=1537797 RepID=UPI001B3636A8
TNGTQRAILGTRRHIDPNSEAWIGGEAGSVAAGTTSRSSTSALAYRGRRGRGRKREEQSQEVETGA